MKSIYELAYDYRMAARRLTSIVRFQKRYAASPAGTFRVEAYLRGALGANSPFAAYLKDKVTAEMPKLLEEAVAHFEEKLSVAKAALGYGLVHEHPDFPTTEMVEARRPVAPKPRHPAADELDEEDDED